jgi:hypothetical protein
MLSGASVALGAFLWLAPHAQSGASDTRPAAVAGPVYEGPAAPFVGGVRIPVFEGPAAPFVGGVRVPVFEGPAAPFVGGVRIPVYEGPAAPFIGGVDLRADQDGHATPAE